MLRRANWKIIVTPKFTAMAVGIVSVVAVFYLTMKIS